MSKQEYESPVIECITTEMNGIICQSNIPDGGGEDVGEGEM